MPEEILTSFEEMIIFIKVALAIMSAVIALSIVYNIFSSRIKGKTNLENGIKTNTLDIKNEKEARELRSIEEKQERLKRETLEAEVHKELNTKLEDFGKEQVKQGKEMVNIGTMQGHMNKTLERLVSLSDNRK